jgi:hypothetical protein
LGTPRGGLYGQPAGTTSSPPAHPPAAGPDPEQSCFDQNYLIFLSFLSNVFVWFKNCHVCTKGPLVHEDFQGKRNTWGEHKFRLIKGGTDELWKEVEIA